MWGRAGKRACRVRARDTHVCRGSGRGGHGHGPCITARQHTVGVWHQGVRGGIGAAGMKATGLAHAFAARLPQVLVLLTELLLCRISRSMSVMSEAKFDALKCLYAINWVGASVVPAQPLLRLSNTPGLRARGQATPSLLISILHKSSRESFAQAHRTPSASMSINTQTECQHPAASPAQILQKTVLHSGRAHGGQHAAHAKLHCTPVGKPHNARGLALYPVGSLTSTRM